jgi:hypothetical protein
MAEQVVASAAAAVAVKMAAALAAAKPYLFLQQR